MISRQSLLSMEKKNKKYTIERESTRETRAPDSMQNSSSLAMLPENFKMGRQNK